MSTVPFLSSSLLQIERTSSRPMTVGTPTAAQGAPGAEVRLRLFVLKNVDVLSTKTVPCMHSGRLESVARKQYGCLRTQL